ncbi:MAG TPA: hypothetical protein DD435_09690 [Cyanobacteria bacterium UBA8530]|nr:hypothetical protein [Cyanobacteria bacterium UBA8530]
MLEWSEREEEQMNETVKTILARRAIRNFKDKAVPEEVLETVLECARFAPSAMNAQPSKFVMVRDKAVREEIGEKAKGLARSFLEGLKKNFPERYEVINKRFTDLADPVFYGAPALLIIVAKGDFAESSAALAAENAMIAAKSLGLGTCPIGLAVGLGQDPEVRKWLKLGEEEKIKVILAIGYPDEEPEAAPRTSETIWL